MVVQDFVFLDSTSISLESNVLDVRYDAKQITLEVQPVVTGGTVNITVKGKVDSNSNVFTNLAVLSATSLENVASITAAGIYYIPVEGIRSCKLVSATTAGDTKAIGRITV